MRVLILGITGFAGTHLARELVHQGDEIWGAARRGASAPSSVRIAERDVPLLDCDVTSRPAIAAALDAAKPDAVVLLAGIAFPPEAESDPSEAYRVHTMGAVHLLEEVAKRRGSARVLLVTSSEVYGQVGEHELPVTEETPLRPVTIYGASKAAADLAGSAFAAAKRCEVVRVRPFNHTGPGQRPDFVCPDFAAQVARIACGSGSGTIEVGNLEVQRDFSDVRDIVRGYRAALERGKSGEVYNLCSGRATAVADVLRDLCELAGIQAEVRSTPGRIRNTEVQAYWGSAAKATRELGWQPEIPWRKTLEDLLVWSKERECGAGAAVE